MSDSPWALLIQDLPRPKYNLHVVCNLSSVFLSAIVFGALDWANRFHELQVGFPKAFKNVRNIVPWLGGYSFGLSLMLICDQAIRRTNFDERYGRELMAMREEFFELLLKDKHRVD
jgi:hypothetical protein